MATQERDEVPPSMREVIDLVSEDDGALLLCCTDQGQHSRIVLGSAAPFDDGPRHLWNSVERQRITPGSTVYVDANRTVHIRCTRCQPVRHVEWREGRADAIVNELLAAGFPELDISKIP